MPTEPGDGLTRRTFLRGASLLPLLAIAPQLVASAVARGAGYRFFTAHQAAVVVAATARLVPGPHDDPAETGHPGAREADVVGYIDTMLSAFDFSVPRVHAGGPYSNRHDPQAPDYMARFVALDPAQSHAWRLRIARLRRTYVAGIAALDKAAGGDFAAASAQQQDQALTSDDAFRDVLFTHTVEGLYAVPEYGGNAGLTAWHEIRWPGDVQPVGYPAAQVEGSDGLDPVNPTGAVALVLDNLQLAARAMVDRGWPRGR